ncbi:MAG: phosphoribosyltransferase [Nitrososphaerota archaeon]|nr:phosphoribosyltransferase [Nitrososphaerota archaeon]
MYRDREDAGARLAGALGFLKGRAGVLVLAIPRGGVPVARVVADSLASPLDIVITRKVGAPENPELAIGAVTQEGEPIIDRDMVRLLRVPQKYLDLEVKAQEGEVRRRMVAYRGERPFPSLRGKVVVIVDDGIATGATAKAAVASVRAGGAAEVIVAAPVGSREAVAELATVADRVVCPSTPEPFYAIGGFYDRFDQVDDETVRKALSGSPGTRQG